ncbi:MAG: hypothetical protein EOO90_11095 [Pedobacter sp.]|nr:MAG: hypothetical protein EOO90_11095 [Pedobacter sp.]
MLYAQQRTKIVLQASERLRVDNITQISHVKKPIFEHDGAILTCDSARLWAELNYFEAFGNVHINQDTINIYSDLLNYDGNAKMAYLMRNVRMSDPSTTLTTNAFDYNMNTRVGTYVNNGKIVNKEGTSVTSKRGYYLASTKDAYFRYDVVVLTDQATITSDSLRYNTFTNQTYFYGPTNIKGKDDNLYTENGEYNTKTEKAFFGKKNLYTQNTKALKGDSLYYDGKKGYGKAVKNIIFTDSQDKLELRGQLGQYYKIDERIVVSDQAYVVMGTADTITVDDKRIPDSLWLGADILEAKMTLQKNLKLILKPVVLADDEVGEEEEKPAAEKSAQPPKTNVSTAKDEESKRSKNKASEEKKEIPAKPIDSLKANVDSVKIAIDTAKQIIKGLTNTDSLKIDSALKKPLVKDDSVKTPSVKMTTKIDSAIKNVKTTDVPNKKTPSTTLVKPIPKDTLPPSPADTVRTRIIIAYNNVRVYKSNLQSKSDSLFFSAADSTLRLYQNPILWSDSTQQTGDTIHVQFKNKKINSAQIFPNAFIASQETDTTKFNQIKGKIITAFFNDGEIKDMYVDGNAESIYFDRQKDGKYQLNQTISARIKVTFEDKEIGFVKTIKAVEGTFLPAEKLGKDGILTGFIWKPELRPKSKNDIINGPPIKKTASPPPAKTKPKAVAATSSKKPNAKNIEPTKSKITDPKPKMDPKPVPIDSAKKTLDSTKTEVKTLRLDSVKKG